MQQALLEAKTAESHDDVPIGAVVVLHNEIIGRGHNERELRQDPTAHAEIIALRQAAAAVGSWRLLDAELFVTLEPCAMCAGAAVLARIGKLRFATPDPKAGAVESLYNICGDQRLNHQIDVQSGPLTAEASAMLRAFFASRR